MRYMIDADMDKYFCAILSDDKEYDFDKQAVRVEKEDDALILYGSESNSIPIAIIPWININMLITKRRLKTWWEQNITIK